MGETLGLAASTGSLSRVFGPVIGGTLTEIVGYREVGWCAGFLAIVMVPFSFFYLPQRPSQQFKR